MTSHTESHVLVFNAGSSSLKFELFAWRPVWRSCCRGAIRDIGRSHSTFEIDDERVGAADRVSSYSDAAELVIESILNRPRGFELSVDSLTATCHRIVHGADRFVAPTLITAAVRKELQELSDLAPLHIPASLAVVDAAADRFAGVSAIAVFDTMFFRDLPDYVRRYALPSGWSEEPGVQRFGFHGIAHEDMRDRLVRRSAGSYRPSRVVTLHLGHGCSAAALKDERPVETSMGFTPLEGLIMATRPGDVDAGAILHMLRRGRSLDALADDLNHESGLRGLSGVSGDVRELLALESDGHEGAALALSAFCHRIRKYLGSYAVVLGGLDAVVFGGGIGENAPAIRSRVCAGLEWLGLELDEAANAAFAGTEAQISTPSSGIDVYVIPVHEEEAIAKAVLASLKLQAGRTGLSSTQAVGSP